jgi:phytoene dehydrogenase-like protein
MFAGMAAHSVLPLDRPLTAAVGLMFCVTAHAGGWPSPRGGSRQIARALEAYLDSLGSRVETGVRVARLSDIPPAKAILFDTSPRQLCQIAEDVLPAAYRRRLLRFRHGPGVFKVDWALDGPIPWKARVCREAGTVHVGGSFAEVAAAERAAWSTNPAEKPFVLVAQQSLFDASRAPAGKHTGWAYCHVPHASSMDMTERIEARLEEFAPGFRDLILARHTMSPAEFERYNANYIGGDITGGVMDLGQIFARPASRLTPYTTPARSLFICSASTPPGAGVHGMCGYYAAQAALRTVFKHGMSR